MSMTRAPLGTDVTSMLPSAAFEACGAALLPAAFDVFEVFSSGLATAEAFCVAVERPQPANVDAARTAKRRIETRLFEAIDLMSFLGTLEPRGRTLLVSPLRVPASPRLFSLVGVPCSRST